MEELDELLANCGFVKQIRINTFQNIEKFIGFTLPDDYQYYLNNYSNFEGFIKEQYISLYNPNNLIEVNKEYGVKPNSNTIIIGNNGASEIIGIRMMNKNEYQIFITQYIEDIEEYIEIGNSFTDMIKRLYSGTGWFDN